MNGGSCTDLVNGYECTCVSSPGRRLEEESSAYDLTSFFDAGLGERRSLSSDLSIKLPEGVYTEPADLRSSAQDSVIDLVIGKEGYGQIKFDVAGFNVTDTSGIDLSEDLLFTGEEGKMTSVTLYPTQETKPEQGTKLNKPATITVYFDKDWEESRVQELVEGQDDVEYVSFNRATKELTFRVQHFSTYGFGDAPVIKKAAPKATR